MKPSMSRREFFKTGAVAGAAGMVSKTVAARSRSVLGANDRIGVGFIGVGIRGIYLVEGTEQIQGAEVRACCDLYDGHLDRIKEIDTPDVELTKSYQKLLDNKDVDAVVIATPDHWHKQMVLDSLSAGKDVYVEKPMTIRWEDAKVFEDAVKKSSQVLQVGSQQASNPANDKVKELIESGALGKVTFIHGAFHRNTPTGAWYYPIPPDASEKTVDWKKFVGDTEWHDFDLNRFFQWRLYWDYSGGLATDLFVHLVTGTHTIMGNVMPKRVIASGGQFNWMEHRDVPDHLSAMAEYDMGYILSLTATASNAHNYPLLTVYGTEGTVALWEFPSRCIHYHEPIRDSFGYPTHSWPEATRRKFAEQNDLNPQTMRPLNSPSRNKPEEFRFSQNPMMVHLESFFSSVKTRKQPFEDVTFGGNAVNVGHMVNVSYREGKPAFWDEKERKVKV